MPNNQMLVSDETEPDILLEYQLELSLAIKRFLNVFMFCAKYIYN